MENIKVGVIGVGALGQHHTRLYSQLSGADLVGVFDTDDDAARRIAKEFQTESFNSLEDLAAAVDCVSVAVPTDLHLEVTSELLRLGKHVLVEKPLAADSTEGRQLISLAREHNRVLQVGHVERYNPVITYLEQKIYNPRFIEAHRLAPYPPPRPGMLPRGTEVGVVLDLMIHDIDVILSLVKSDVTSVDAVGIPILSKSEDIANARISFANGCVANLTASRVSQERMRKIRVFQADAYLSLDYQEKKGEIVTLAGASIGREPVPIADHDALKMELEDFLSCAREVISSNVLAEPKVSAAHALSALEVAEAIASKMHEQTE